MNTYLLDDDVNYKILILYILKDLNTDIKRAIYDILVTYEIIEITTQGWTELTYKVYRINFIIICMIHMMI